MGPWKNTPAWREIEVPSRKLHRRERLMGIIRDLDVEDAVRYRRQGRTTYCNIYATDIIKNMRVTAPRHWMYKGVPSEGTSFAHEYTANMLHDWFDEHGSKFGWKEVTLDEAKQLAASESLAIAIWKNPDTRRLPGHIAVFRPDGLITQAGLSNFESGTLEQGFGTAKPVRFFATSEVPQAKIYR